jgi:cell division transport system permease protein
MAHSEIPFAKDDAHTFLPWIISVMACMAALLLCLGLTAGGWIVDKHDTYTNHFTVNIPATVEDLPAKLSKIQGMLEKYPGVTSVSQVSERHLRELLKPWLGNSDSIEGLPIPSVLDVVADGKTPVDYIALQIKLDAIATGTEVDAHERWVATFSSFSASARYAIGSLAVLIIGALGLMIAFTSRTAFKLHTKTVQLLHSIGAEDGYIARQFQREAFMLTIRGTAPGCIIAGIMYWVVGWYLASLHASMLPSLAMNSSHVLLLALMPLICGAVAWAAARLSVIKQLQRSL